LAIRLIITALGFFCLTSSFATQVGGKVKDAMGEALPFVNIYVKGSNRSTTSNTQCQYALDLPDGKHELVFRMVGYKSQTVEIELKGTPIEKNIVLLEETYNLKEVTIKGDGEDPAYQVIRNAIKKRKYHLEQVNTFSCDVYIKGVQKVTKYPKKIMGIEIDPEGDIDTATGIVYLSESVSKFYFRQPDKIREEMVSSKVSGNNRAFSYNRASDMLFNFYQNIIEVGGLSERGFVSPINNNALFYYRYKLEGTFFENGEMINKIKVIPKRKNDPCFSGYIYIIENTWKIHSTELRLTKDAQIDFVDTLNIIQVHFPVNKDVWMVLSNKFEFTFNVLGIQGNGIYLGVNANYVIDPELPKKFFGPEEMKIQENANQKDSGYWQDTRPVPLTPEEVRDYQKRDSLEKIRTSKPYLDSVDRISNKITLGKLFIAGYTYNQRYKKREFYFSPMARNVRFNTVRGFNAGIETGLEKQLEKNREYDLDLAVYYGFSDRALTYEAGWNFLYNPSRFSRIIIKAGQTQPQYNEDSPIGPLVNSFYSLLAEQNFAKYFQKSFVYAEHDFEIINGLYVKTGFEYAERSPLFNTTQYTWRNLAKREYTSNDPLDPDDNFFPGFATNRIFKVEGSVRIRFGQKYYTRPNQKILLGSKYPTLSLSYSKAIPGVLGSEMDFDEIRVSVRDRVKLKLLGTSRYSVSVGKFFSSKTMEFMDSHHFGGNQTIYSDFRLAQFNLLDYYAYSTNDAYIEAHLEHRFGGFILNKFPLIRKLKLSEIGGVHYLSSPSLPQYLEVYFGLEKLRIVRVDFVMAFSSNIQINSGFRIGFPLF
jgi:hypothetical protein